MPLSVAVLLRAAARCQRRIDRIDQELVRLDHTTAPPGNTDWPAERQHIRRVLNKARKSQNERRTLLRRLIKVEQGEIAPQYADRAWLYRRKLLMGLARNHARSKPMQGRARDLVDIVRTCVVEHREALFGQWMIASLRELNTARRLGQDRRFIYANEWDRGVYRFPERSWMADAPVDDDHPAHSITMNFANTEDFSASAALEDLFTWDAHPIAIECMSALHICFLRAFMKTVGTAALDGVTEDIVQVAPGDEGSVSKLRVALAVDSVDQLRPGDWVYFYNHPDYVKRHHDSSFATWQGANAVYLGNVSGEPRFTTFDSQDPAWTEAEFVTFLLKEYNRKPDGPNRGQLANRFPQLGSSDDIPGLRCPDPAQQGRISPVYRIDVKELARWR
ncbi:hypothetical protein WME95_38620 [Sorangium sp. So ce327]|uniref:hypothetical protein n=1 Tax=Sorangium sp. So ce327 TaxID=3133301 RepID=UPI003F648E5F